MDSNTLRTIFNCIKANDFRLILVMGVGVVGKSYFVNQLKNLFISENKTCSTIDLDGFLLSRKIRMKDGWITAHNPAAYDKDLLNSKLQNLVLNNMREQIPFHNKQKHNSTFKAIDPCYSYIIEGAVSFYFNIFDYADLKIYIWSEKKIQFINRSCRESKELGYDEKISRERFELYWNDYVKFIQPKRTEADIVIKIDRNYVGIIEKLHPRCLTTG